jgi:hypothetical protein
MRHPSTTTSIAFDFLSSAASRRRLLVTALAVLVCLGPRAVCAAEKASGYQTALESIRAADLFEPVRDLADKALEGREAGSPGGHAAGDYLTARLAKLHLTPAGTQGYFQPFQQGFRNILATLPGSDPQQKTYYVLIGAHYDHLGHGLRRKPGDPPGPIYPGADDNASGSSGVLAVARALALLPESPRRSILLVWWDAEEKGLLGSKHWTGHPTLPLDHLSAVVNLDMIGVLRQDRLEVFGARTGYGLRRLLCEQNRESGLVLDFCWTMQANADHFPFFQHGIPVVFFNTGLHARYHQPSDDAAHVDAEGMMRVARYAFAVSCELANQPAAPRFRAAAGRETEDDRRRLALPEPSPVRPGDPPLRLGIAWRLDEAEPGTIVVSHVVAGSPAAAAGLRVGDRVLRIAGRDFADDAAFAKLAATLPGPLDLLVERDGRCQVLVLRFPAEAGEKKRAA